METDDNIDDGTAGNIQSNNLSTPNNMTIVNTTHQSVPSHNNNIPTRDDGIRHIYLNNSEESPIKIIGHTNPINRAAELKSLIGWILS